MFSELMDTTGKIAFSGSWNSRKNGYLGARTAGPSSSSVLSAASNKAMGQFSSVGGNSIKTFYDAIKSRVR